MPSAGGVDLFAALAAPRPPTPHRSPKPPAMDEPLPREKTSRWTRALTPDPHGRPSFARSENSSRASFVAEAPVHPTTPIPFDPDEVSSDEEDPKGRKAKSKSIWRKKLWRRSKAPPPTEVPPFLEFEVPSPLPLGMPDNRPRRSMGSDQSMGAAKLIKKPPPGEYMPPPTIKRAPYSGNPIAPRAQPLTMLRHGYKPEPAPSISDAASIAESSVLGPLGIRPDSMVIGSTTGTRGARSVMSSLYVPVDAESILDDGESIVNFDQDAWPIPPQRDGLPDAPVRSSASVSTSNSSGTRGPKKATAPVLGDFRSVLSVTQHKRMVAQQYINHGITPPIIREDEEGDVELAHLREVLASPPRQDRLRSGSSGALGVPPASVAPEVSAATTRWVEVAAGYPAPPLEPTSPPASASIPSTPAAARAMPRTPETGSARISMAASSGKSTHPTQAAYLRYADDNGSISNGSVITRSSRAIGLEEEVFMRAPVGSPASHRAHSRAGTSQSAIKIPPFPCTNEEVLPVTLHRGPLQRHLPMPASSTSKFFSTKSRRWRQTFCALTQVDDAFHLHCFEPQPLEPVWPEVGRLGLRATSIICVLGDGLDGEAIVLKITGAELGGTISSSDPIPASQMVEPAGQKRRGPYGDRREAVWLFAMTGIPHLKAWMSMLKDIVGTLKDKEADLRAARPPPDVEEEPWAAIPRVIGSVVPAPAHGLLPEAGLQPHPYNTRPAASEDVHISAASSHTRIGHLARSQSARSPESAGVPASPRPVNLDLLPADSRSSPVPSSHSSAGRKSKSRTRARSTSASLRRDQLAGGTILASQAPRNRVFIDDDELEVGPGPSLLPRSPSSSNGSPDAAWPGWNNARLSGCDYVDTSPALTAPTSLSWSNEGASIKSSTTSSSMRRRSYLAASSLPPAGPPPTVPLPPLPSVSPSPPPTEQASGKLPDMTPSPKPKPKKRVMDVWEEAQAELGPRATSPPPKPRGSPTIRFKQ